jgi:flagellin-specific chaperone FliS
MKTSSDIKAEQQEKTINLLSAKVSRLERAISLLERENKRRRDEVLQLAQRITNR